MLRSIRYIHNREIDTCQLEELYKQRDKIKKQKEFDYEEYCILQDEINRILYIPEYITIVMEHQSHYRHLFYNGLKLNDKKYVRFSCSAGQARLSTVVFVEEETAEKLNKILDNGRDLNKPLVPSKFNAYKGLSGSATKIVSPPRFCVVPDYISKLKVQVNFVTETELQKDDEISVKEVELEFNRFDGQGLISPTQAEKWADELGLDYVPAQWCVRQNFLKGMLCVFDFHKFCETENNNNYIIKTINKQEDGSQKEVDLRNIDVIISESQMKLWDSWSSIEEYQDNCNKNKLNWGVSLHSPKKDHDLLNMNYQFLQTLNLSKKDIEDVCSQFVQWIEGVNSKDIYYTLLFLLGKENTDEKILNYMSYSKNFWVKSLIVNHELIKDKYIRDKIYDLVKQKIKNACLGEIFVDGNFQTIVSDPYAMMQHICGQELVTGILSSREYYSAYWNSKNVKVVDSMRAPLTFRSEHLKLHLVENEKLNEWFKYCYTGIIVNVHGHETLNWAGSDFDYDILATTSNKTIIDGVYEDELPVYYEPPKSKKEEITDEKLYKADLFAFGSAIGSITNKSTSGYALLPLFKNSSKEYKTIMDRLKMCTKLQSAQIDKAKIGRNVKGIPSIWINRSKPSENLSEDECIFLSSIMLNRHPYFFTYLYPKTKQQYKKHIENYNLKSKYLFGLTLDELLNKAKKSSSEREFAKEYRDTMPVIESDSVMNNLCKYIESIEFDIKNKLKAASQNTYELLLPSGIEEEQGVYDLIYKIIKKYKKTTSSKGRLGILQKEKEEDSLNIVVNHEEIMKKLYDACSNTDTLIYHLVKLFYVKHPSLNKDILWELYGENLFTNVLKNTQESIFFPMPKIDGEIEYLRGRYDLEEVKFELE